MYGSVFYGGYILIFTWKLNKMLFLWPPNICIYMHLDFTFLWLFFLHVFLKINFNNHKHIFMTCTVYTNGANTYGTEGGEADEYVGGFIRAAVRVLHKL